jgi:tRNA A-37 threonylcarbamoyl transferase component Bud32
MSSGKILKEQETSEILNIISSLHKNGVRVRKITGKRETWRVSLSGSTYYVKISFQNKLIRKVASFLKLSQPQRELRAFQKLKHMDILIPELVAYYRENGAILPQKEYIIMREIEKGQSLTDLLLNDFFLLTRKEQKKLILDFSNYIRNLHDSGVIHSDPNLGNFLIMQDNGKNYFYLLDLADVKIRPSLSVKERWNNLSLLNLSFFKRVPESLRYYFLKNYSHSFLKLKKDVLLAIEKIESTSLKMASKTWSKRTLWCLGDNSFFHAARYGPFEIHLKRSYDDIKGLKQILNFPDTFMGEVGSRVLKNGRTVKATVVDIEGGRSLFLKRYNKKGFFHTFKNIFRSSRASHVWLNNYKFELRGIPIPPPVAYMEERRGRILKRSYIINEFIHDTIMLNFLFEPQKENVPYKEKLSIMREVGREIGKMHRLGCLHGDMKWSNLLIKKINDNYKCFFIDLDSSKVKKNLTLLEIIDELGRFYIEMIKYKLNPEIQEIFFKAYYKHCCLVISYETLVKKVKAKAMKKVRNLI